MEHKNSNSYFKQCRQGIWNSNSEEQSIAEKLISVLEPFKCETEILVPRIIPQCTRCYQLTKKLSKWVATDDEHPQPHPHPPVIRSVKNKMRVELEKRTESEQVSITACVLKPYRKNFEFMPSLKVEVRGFLLKLAQCTSVTVEQEKTNDVNNNQ